jgi:probable HAF family extracellular repeat protein
MKSRKSILIIVIALFALLALPVQLAAQHSRYRLIDLGTFGGPSSYLATSNGVTSPGMVNQVVNTRATAAGWADTSTVDPYAPNCFNFDCFVSHASQWQKDTMTDLGVLPDGQSSSATWISDTGLIAGQSQNGMIDPLVPGFPEIRAVLWSDGHIINLGTLGGNESSAFSVNNRGQVVGVAVNSIADPFSFFATQLRAFLWQGGAMHDLGTLGGPEAWALFVNERGQVAGFSFTNDAVNPATGSPTQDPFLWDNGKMIDLGTLGGTLGFPYGLNNRGQVVGTSNLAGDLPTHAHPFLWPGVKGKMQDLGTFGGSFGIAAGINDSAEVVGGATNENDQAVLAFLWKDGVMTNLGTLNGDDCSFAFHINSKGQIVGFSFPCATGPDGPNVHGFLWQNGFMTDLNAFVPFGSGLTLGFAGFINDRGGIAGAAGLPDGSTHAVLLVPCGEGEEGCADAPLDLSIVAKSEPESGVVRKPMTAGELATFKERLARMAGRNRGFGFWPRK